MFTTEEDDFLRANYLTLPAKRMSLLLGRREATARQRMKILGIEVPIEIIQKFKKESRFKPGQPSWNKGMKGLQIGGKETQFKKGGEPHNTKPEGAISIRTETMKNGVKRSYQYLRLSKGNWKPLHVHIWEQANGPVVKGIAIVFKDGDTMNCELENLESLTRKELRIRNSGSTLLTDKYVARMLSGSNTENDPAVYLERPELIELKRTQLKLNRAINEHSR